MMKLAIMQPYFFPYIGYFQLIAAVDVFVVYDDVQYIKNGWINRNQILLNKRASWITLPVERGHLHDNINQRHFVNYKQACVKILNQLYAAYRKAPCFREANSLIESLLMLKGDNVAGTLKRQLEELSRCLDFSTKFINSADLKQPEAALDGQDRVIEICRAMKASEYYNAIGGIPLYDPAAFAQSGITLRFLQPRHTTYKQFDHPFVPNLSLIDVLMFNRLEQVNRMLLEFDLLDKPLGFS
jgi:hypothetical protein